MTEELKPCRYCNDGKYLYWVRSIVNDKHMSNKDKIDTLLGYKPLNNISLNTRNEQRCDECIYFNKNDCNWCRYLDVIEVKPDFYCKSFEPKEK